MFFSETLARDCNPSLSNSPHWIGAETQITLVVREPQMSDCGEWRNYVWRISFIPRTDADWTILADRRSDGRKGKNFVSADRPLVAAPKYAGDEKTQSQSMTTIQQLFTWRLCAHRQMDSNEKTWQTTKTPFVCVPWVCTPDDPDFLLCPTFGGHG